MPDIFVSKKADPPPTVQTEKEVITPPSGNRVRLLTSFRLNPAGLEYSDLEPNETVFLFLRRHFATNVPWIVEGIFLIVAPLIVGALVNILNLNLAIVSGNLLLFVILFYYLLVIEFFFLNFLNWFYNISLVTNEKVVDIDFKILFSKNVASTKIVQIEDVSLNEVGLIRAVFDYGDVIVQTAGTAEFFEFLAVPHPEQVVHVIGDLIGARNAV